MRRKFVKKMEAVYQLLASNKLFFFILAVFVLQGLWLAVSAWRLPYDEYYHIGIIQFYAGQWSPFVTVQPTETALYGDILRLPSYLYHYLMSFPYRALSDVVHSEVLLIFLLRLMNMGLVVGAVLLFRKLFLEAGFSKRIISVGVALFLLTPMVVVLAAQSNYDNLILLLTPLLLLLAYRLMTGFITFEKVLLFLSIGMFGSIVKHSFLSIFFGVTLVIALSAIKKKDKGYMFTRLQHFFSAPHKMRLVGICVLFLLAGFLFTERQVVNVLRYQQINVDCATVHSKEFCANYSPWRRNESEKTKKQMGLQEPMFSNVAGFGVHWVTTMMRGMFAVFANIPNTTETATEDPYGHYVFMPLLPIVTMLGYIGIALGLIAIIFSLKRLWAHPLNRLLLLVSAGLLATLFVFNYTTYLRIGKPYAVQVRYMFPLLLPLYIIALQAVRFHLTSKTLQTMVASIVILLFIYSGGIAGWILRSQQNWYIQNDTVVSMNETAQHFLKKIIIH